MSTNWGYARERLKQEAELWEQLAERLSNPSYKAPWGLCHELDRLLEHRYRGEPFDVPVARSMHYRLQYYIRDHFVMNSRMCGYVYPPGTERAARALACLWLAQEASSEDARPGWVAR